MALNYRGGDERGRRRVRPGITSDGKEGLVNLGEADEMVSETTFISVSVQIRRLGQGICIDDDAFLIHFFRLLFPSRRRKLRR